MTVTVRRIRAEEGLRLRALRLSALADVPMAFGSTLAREEAFPERVWHERAAGGATSTDRATFVAEQDDEWVGLATGLALDPEEPERPEPVLVGMFVAPGDRGRGVGAALVEAVAGWARARGALRLNLWVSAPNRPAIALYARCGFRPTGESKPLAHTRSVTELRMTRDLT